ncbi:hypothetical protein RSAG8_09982, partial [Rhizoctonia solani AG-8 WAC10335]
MVILVQVVLLEWWPLLGYIRSYPADSCSASLLTLRGASLFILVHVNAPAVSIALATSKCTLYPRRIYTPWQRPQPTSARYSPLGLRYPLRSLYHML